jgi:hypothetical protein
MPNKAVCGYGTMESGGKVLDKHIADVYVDSDSVIIDRWVYLMS